MALCILDATFDDSTNFTVQLAGIGSRRAFRRGLHASVRQDGDGDLGRVHVDESVGARDSRALATKGECRVASERQRRIVSLIASARRSFVRWAGAIGSSAAATNATTRRRAEAAAADGGQFKVEGLSAEIDRRVPEIVRDGLSVLSRARAMFCAISHPTHRDAGPLRGVRGAPQRRRAATCTWTGHRSISSRWKPDSTADVYRDIRRVAGLSFGDAGEASSPTC